MPTELTRRPVPRLHPSQVVQWVLTDHHSIFDECWADGCTRPPIWYLQHFSCRHSTPYDGCTDYRPSAGEHYCNIHSIERGRPAITVPDYEWTGEWAPIAAPPDGRTGGTA